MKLTQFNLPESTEETLHSLAILQGKTPDEVVRDAINFYLSFVNQSQEDQESILDKSENKSINRHAFLNLPMTERRRILAEQAETMAEHYQQDSSWQDWVDFDLGVDDEE